mmetsp:Transcript_21287/g.30031  ORF Transcript_21287/g.30031 Transcript_21287/m.30031 type:complete len:96 (-) Transcript_21287:625-912(-)
MHPTLPPKHWHYTTTPKQRSGTTPPAQQTYSGWPMRAASGKYWRSWLLTWSIPILVEARPLRRLVIILGLLVQHMCEFDKHKRQNMKPKRRRRAE